MQPGLKESMQTFANWAAEILVLLAVELGSETRSLHFKNSKLRMCLNNDNRIQHGPSQGYQIFPDFPDLSRFFEIEEEHVPRSQQRTFCTLICILIKSSCLFASQKEDFLKTSKVEFNRFQYSFFISIKNTD